MEYTLSPLVLLGLVVTGWLVIRRTASHNHSLPPGPKPLPLIGNIHQMPKEREWLVYAKWAKQYGDYRLISIPDTRPHPFQGDIMYLSALGQPVVVLNTQKAAHDLLTKRSNVYSNRPRLVSGICIFFISSVFEMGSGDGRRIVGLIAH
jgi:hypothetical protein